MPELKIYSKNWLKKIVRDANEDERPSYDVFTDLMAKLNGYIAHLDEIDSRRGKGMSPAKYAAILQNSKKGGWKKGVPRKKPQEVQYGSDK